MPPLSVLTAYNLENTIVTQLGSGNINNTYLVSCGTETLVLQAINYKVFPNPAIIDANLACLKRFFATQHLSYAIPTPLPNRTGITLTWDETAIPWRLMSYISDSEIFTVAPTVDHAYQAARSFADFSARLSTLPPNSLHTTIPDFHNLTKREDELRHALRRTTDARRKGATEIIRGLAEFQYIGEQYRTLITKGVWRIRICHHDTKLTNILFKTNSASIAAIIDLDTTMPGYVFSDIGDLLMFGTSVFEDETNTDQIIIDTEKYAAILAGYRAGSGDTLSLEESALLTQAPLIMCYMLALRFLSDYLNGDTYFKTNYFGQNLDKARNRLILLRQLATLT